MADATARAIYNCVIPTLPPLALVAIVLWTTMHLLYTREYILRTFHILKLHRCSDMRFSYLYSRPPAVVSMHSVVPC